jgi:DNA mismatch endonuclease Vsr
MERVGQTRRRIGKHLVVSDPTTSRRLARFGHETTEPERLVRRYLFAQGYRFRVHNRDLPGSPDIANRSRRWAVFVHGCFWHHHIRCSRATVPARNRAFWLAKFRDNHRRDRRVVTELEKHAFVVAVLWECQVKQPWFLHRRLSTLLRTQARIRARSVRACSSKDRTRIGSLGPQLR